MPQRLPFSDAARIGAEVYVGVDQPGQQRRISDSATTHRRVAARRTAARDDRGAIDDDNRATGDRPFPSKTPAVP